MQTNLPKPRVAIVNSSIPNAFATGRDANHAVVAVTDWHPQSAFPARDGGRTGPRTDAYLNRDMLVMTVATFFSMVAALLARNLVWFGMFGGFGGMAAAATAGADVAIVRARQFSSPCSFRCSSGS